MEGKARRILAVVVGSLILLGAAVTTGLLRLSAPANDKAGPRASGLPVPARVEPGPTRVDYRRFEMRVAELMRDLDMVGLAVATVERGQVRFLKGFGETVAGSGRPVTPDTVFRWASLSKSVASALVTGLAADGKVSLDAPLASMRTTLTLPGDASRVTVADLLSHRLGLVRNAWDERLEAGEDPKMLRAALGSLPPFCPPATCYAYQNIAYDAASEIVEQVTQRDYASVARARLFEPLGMSHTSLGRTALQAEADWARPHHRGRRLATVNDNYYRVPAAGGVNSSIRDLARWMQAQMGAAPAILPPAMLETMHRPRVSTPPHGRRSAMDRALANGAYGLGWRSFSYAGHALVGHRGSVDGYGSLILFDPAEKSGIVMLWNSNQYTAARLQLEFFDLLYGLPPTDWLELGDKPADANTIPAGGSLPPPQ